jgi:AcrR family transcriptional regulator
MVVKRRLSSDERKARTLERVTRVFAKKGFEGTTSSALAKAAGVSEAMLYKLFGSKKRLYQAMIEHKLEHAGWGDFPVEPGQSDRDFFTGMARAIFEKVDADPDFCRLLLFSDLQGSPFAQMFHEALGQTVLAAVGDVIRQRIEAGAFRAVDPDLAGLTFLCTCWQYALATKVFPTGRVPEVGDEQVIDTVVGLFLDGVAA